MFPVLVLACIPLSIPSFYLAFRLYKIRYLDSIFNQHLALMMIFSGINSLKYLNLLNLSDYLAGFILPISLAIAILR